MTFPTTIHGGHETTSRFRTSSRSQMTERDPRPSLEDRRNREGRRRGGNPWIFPNIPSPPLLPSLWIPLGRDRRAGLGPRWWEAFAERMRSRPRAFPPRGGRILSGSGEGISTARVRGSMGVPRHRDPRSLGVRIRSALGKLERRRGRARRRLAHDLRVVGRVRRRRCLRGRGVRPHVLGRIGLRLADPLHLERVGRAQRLRGAVEVGMRGLRGPGPLPDLREPELLRRGRGMPRESELHGGRVRSVSTKPRAHPIRATRPGRRSGRRTRRGLPSRSASSSPVRTPACRRCPPLEGSRLPAYRASLRVLAPLVGVLVLVGLEALARDLDLDLALAHDLRLTAEPRRGPHVERLVEDVGLFVLLLAEQLAPRASRARGTSSRRRRRRTRCPRGSAPASPPRGATCRAAPRPRRIP